MTADDILQESHEAMLNAVDGLNELHWETPGVYGNWSVKDIIAHLASYEQLLIDVLSSVTDADAPTEVLNAYIQDEVAFDDTQMAIRRAYSAPEILAEYNRLAAQSQALLAELPASVREEQGSLPWYGADATLDDFLVQIIDKHTREHAAQIAEFRDALPPSTSGT